MPKMYADGYTKDKVGWIPIIIEFTLPNCDKLLRMFYFKKYQTGEILVYKIMA